MKIRDPHVWTHPHRSLVVLLCKRGIDSATYPGLGDVEPHFCLPASFLVDWYVLAHTQKFAQEGQKVVH